MNAITRSALLVGGALSSVVYLAAIDVGVPLRYPGAHSYTGQMVSELMALRAPTRPFLLAPMWLYNGLAFALAAGVAASTQARTARMVAAVALAGYALCSTAGLSMAPMEPRADGISAQTRLHIWMTAAQGLFMIVALIGGAFAHGRRFFAYSLLSAATSAGFGAMASMQAASGSMRWIGLTERVSIYAWMIWTAVLAVSLLPGFSISGRRASS